MGEINERTKVPIAFIVGVACAYGYAVGWKEKLITTIDRVAAHDVYLKSLDDNNQAMRGDQGMIRVDIAELKTMSRMQGEHIERIGAAVRELLRIKKANYEIMGE